MIASFCRLLAILENKDENYYFYNSGIKAWNKFQNLFEDMIQKNKICFYKNKDGGIFCTAEYNPECEKKNCTCKCIFIGDNARRAIMTRGYRKDDIPFGSNGNIDVFMDVLGKYISSDDFYNLGKKKDEDDGFSKLKKKIETECVGTNSGKIILMNLIKTADWNFNSQLTEELKLLLTDMLLVYRRKYDVIALLMLISLYIEEKDLFTLFEFLSAFDTYNAYKFSEWMDLSKKEIILPSLSIIQNTEEKQETDSNISQNSPEPTIEASTSGDVEKIDGFYKEAFIDALIDVAIEMHKRACDGCRLLPYSTSDENKKMDLPTLNVESTVTGNGSRGVKLEDVLKDNGDNIMITGSGGCGKTYSLLECANNMLSDDGKIIPLYIPLNVFNVSNFSSIEDYVINKLKVKYDNDYSMASRAYYKFISETGANSSKIIFLCDGFNEVISKEVQSKIIHNIKELQHTAIYRFVITSRYDLSSTFATDSGNVSNHGFSSYVVNELKDDVIKDYVENFLENEGVVDYEKIIDNELCENKSNSPITPKKEYTVKEIYKTPMAIVMFCGIHSTVSSNVRSAEFYSPVKRLGELLHNFILCVRNGTKSDRNKKDEKFLRYLGYRMNIDGVFTISKTAFNRYFNDYTEKFGLSDISSDDIWESSLINDFMKKENSSISEISFNHQNFRDYFAASFLYELIISVDLNYIKEFIGIDKKIPNETSILLAELLGEYKALDTGITDSEKTVIQKILKENSGNISPSSVAYLIDIVKTGRKNDLSRFDFTGLDLSLTKLNGVILSSGPANERTKSFFDGAVITKDTLAPVGHAGAPLVMLYIENRYLLSFSKNTVCSFDMSTGVQSVVAAYSEDVILSGVHIIGTNRIITGDSVGVVSLWEYNVVNDKMNISLVKQHNIMNSVYMFAPKERKIRARVQSICQYVNDQILFSMNCGDVFSVDTELNTIPVLKLSLCKENDNYSRFSCIKSDGDDFYVSYGNKIYKNSSDNYCKISNVEGCIYDIALIKNEDYACIIANFREDINSNGTKSVIYKLNVLQFVDSEKNSIIEIKTETHVLSSQGFAGWNRFASSSDDNTCIYLCANINDNSVNPGVYKLEFKSKYDDDGEVTDIINTLYESTYGNKHIMSVECVLPFTYERVKYLATASTDRSIEIMDISKPENNILIYQLPGHTDGVTCMKVIDENTIYTCHYSGEVCKWRCNKQKKWKCTIMEKPHTNWVWAVDALSTPTGQYIVGASYDHNISITDDKTGEYTILKGCRGSIKAFAVVDDDTIIASYECREGEKSIHKIGIFYQIYKKNDKIDYKFKEIDSLANGFLRSMCKTDNIISFCINCESQSEIYSISAEEIKEYISASDKPSLKREPHHTINSDERIKSKALMRSLDCINYKGKNIYACAGNLGHSYAEIWVEGDSDTSKNINDIENLTISENDGFSAVKLVDYNNRLFAIIGSYDHHLYVYEICLDAENGGIADTIKKSVVKMSDKVMSLQYYKGQLYVSLFNGKVVSWSVDKIVELQCDSITEDSAELLFQAKVGLHVMGIDFTKCIQTDMPEDFKRILRCYGKI